jgi:hypothetical protein
MSLVISGTGAVAGDFCGSACAGVGWLLMTVTAVGVESEEASAFCIDVGTVSTRVRDGHWSRRRGKEDAERF